MTWNDLEQLRERWKGTLVVKGIQSVADARLAEQVGVDGIVLSNHGGRQLDATRSPLDVLPEVREALHSDMKIMLDSGVRHGADVVAALASGADFVFLGRAYLYGLMAAGEAGVAKVIDLIEAESRRTMQLLGASNVSALSPALLTK